MANFNLFLPILQQVEGGYQNLSGDKGNYNSKGQLVGTNYGISARFYETVIKRPPTVADIKAITKTLAAQLYKKYFWDAAFGDHMINQSVANLIVDHAVNGGEGAIGKIVQKILVNDFGKKITVDGDIGAKTVEAINQVDQSSLFEKIKNARAVFYYEIGGEFLNGWLTRLKSFTYEKKK